MSEVHTGPLGNIKWTDEMNAYLKEIIPGRTFKEIGKLFKDRFGVELSYRSYTNKKYRLGVKQGVNPTQFKKGIVPHNKNVPQSEWIIPKQKPKPTKKRLNNETISPDGYVLVRVGFNPTTKKYIWRPKHHLVWEEHNGSIPEGHKIIFADKNKRNFDPQNLVAVPYGCLITINSQKIPYYDRESLQLAIDIARLKSGIRSKLKEVKGGR